MGSSQYAQLAGGVVSRLAWTLSFRARDRPEGYVLWALALARDGEIEGARQVIEQLEKEAGSPMEAAVARARLASG